MANWGSNLIVALIFLDLIRLLTPGGTFLLFACLRWRPSPSPGNTCRETNGRTLEQIEADLAAGFSLNKQAVV